MESNYTRQNEFEAFVAEHRRIIGRICYMYAGGSDDFDDMYQEILINIWRGLDTFEGRSSPSSWVYRIGINTCISYRRRNRRFSGTLSLAACAGIIDDTPGGDERLLALRRSIERLDPIEKAVVTLWLDEVPYDEIAAITGLSRNNVASKLHRIKLKLRNENR
ncbi:MAG: sigma-70 family RNA polymerase sigma factor [Alistipes sp.]|nr:sigma-70 family RNA polymerase sigma factor [Alistipes sp.]